MGDQYKLDKKKLDTNRSKKKVYSASKVMRQQEHDKKKTIYEQYKKSSSGT